MVLLGPKKPFNISIVIKTEKFQNCYEMLVGIKMDKTGRIKVSCSTWVRANGWVGIKGRRGYR